MDATDDISNPSGFLAGARPYPGENKFIVGTFERGVTVYRQQIRALNLVYSMVEARERDGNPVIAPGSKITVIGGGAFGATVATAAAYARFNVVLLEKHQTLLHLQRGCDTRWLHPRFYDWPAPEAESQMARLPFLDWSASNAGNIALQIQREIMQLQRGDLSRRLAVDLGVSELTIERIREGLYEVRYCSADGQQVRPCGTVIYAVGFGFENNHGDNESYWRNDRFGQSDLSFANKRVPYVVSGFGDGGLVDVFRLTIRDFRYDRIFREIFAEHGKTFISALNQIRESSVEAEGSIYDKLAALEIGIHKNIVARAKESLAMRLRSDTAVILNSKAPSFRQGLALNSVSFSNALLAYLLFRLDAVKYQRGLIADGSKRILEDASGSQTPEWLANAKSVIIRHGTDRGSALMGVGCESAIPYLRSRLNLDTGKQIFPPGWWGPFVDPISTSASRGIPAPVEYVPPLLRTHATAFVSTLASILGGLLDYRLRKQRASSRKFRVALHRLTQIQGVDVFQQVTPYKGSAKSVGGVGRYFPIEGGIVGLACRTGSLVVARRTNPKKFNKIWELTELRKSGAKNIKPYVDSLLCCPFFAPESASRSQRVVLALFVDSADPRFFEGNTLPTISSACRGFVDLLESLHAERMLQALPASQIGYRVPPSKELAPLKKQLRNLGVRFVDATNKGWKAGLTFKRLESLDLQVGYQDAPV